jgi:fructose transport system substrate-binding protein
VDLARPRRIVVQAGAKACLITKTDTNPFFVKMKEGAEAKAAELGVDAEGLCRQDRRRP